MSNMAYVTISLSNQNKKLLDELCEKEHRDKSNMLTHMLIEYAKNVGMKVERK